SRSPTRPPCRSRRASSSTPTPAIRRRHRRCRLRPRRPSSVPSRLAADRRRRGALAFASATMLARARHLAIAFVFAFVAGGALAQPWQPTGEGLAPIPALSARVTDVTNTLSEDDKREIDSRLSAFEQKTGGQFVVLLMPSMAPEPIEPYSIRVAEAWKIGRKGQDNGIVFLVAK